MMRRTARRTLGPPYDDGTTGPGGIEYVGYRPEPLIFVQLVGQNDENANARPMLNVSLN